MRSLISTIRTAFLSLVFGVAAVESAEGANRPENAARPEHALPRPAVGHVGIQSGAGPPYTMSVATISSGAAFFTDGSFAMVGQPTVGTMSNADYTMTVGVVPAILGPPIPDVVGAAQTAPYPHDRRKNRYLSFDPNKAENDGTNVAFKVEMKAITLGSCAGATGAEVDFCRTDRVPATLDCNACSGAGNACVNQPIDCPPGQTCDSTGETCINDAPHVGGSNVGQVWWVGPEKTTLPADSSVHLLVSEPFRKVSTDWGSEFDPVNHPGKYVVHGGDCEVVPEAVYGIRAVDVGSGSESDELLVETTAYAPISSSWWADCVGPLKKFCGGDIRTPECTSDGDCTAPQTCDRAWTLPDGSVNFDDIGAALAQVAPAPTSVKPDMTWIDLHGNNSGTPGSQNFDPPNFVANFADVGQIIFGFQGLPYKGYDPADCPDTGSWP